MTSIELVTVSVDGQEFTAWDSVAVTAGRSTAARSFTLQCAAELGTQALAWTFAPGKLVEIRSNGDLLCTGYTDKFIPRLDAKSAGVSISGRSKSADLVDCAALDETGFFEQMTPAEILQRLDRFGVGISSEIDLDKIDYQLNPGETVFSVADTLLRSQSATLSGQADGSAKIVGPPTKTMAGELIEGRDFTVGQATHDWSKRYSVYRLRGQRPGGVEDDDLEIEVIARDSKVPRFRPKVGVIAEDTTLGRAKKRARQERDRSAGAGLTAGFTVQGFRDAAGVLWEPGALVWTESPFLLLRQNMMIESVAWRQGPRKTGSTAALSMIDPRAHGGKSGKADGSGDAWDMDSTDAE